MQILGLKGLTLFVTRLLTANNTSPSSSNTSKEKEEENQDYHRGDEQVAICMECYR